jgi:predicted aspartyl protease
MIRAMGETNGPDRRAFALGLMGAALTPSMALAQHEPAAVTPLAASPTDSALAASSDIADRMTVPVMLNGAGPFPFVIDTGSNRTVVSDTLAQQLGLPVGGPLKISAATGVVQTGSVRVDQLSVGHRRLSNLKAPVLPVQHLGALGMLGIDAVADQRIVMDFRKKEMILTTTRRVEEDPAALVVRAKSKYGQLLLVDSWVEGVQLYVIIDTGGETTIGNAAMRAALSRSRREREAQTVNIVSVTGDTAPADLTLLPELHVGNVIVRNQQIAYADLYAFDRFGLHDKPSMLLGMSTLRHCAKVSIDFPAREVRFLLS